MLKIWQTAGSRYIKPHEEMAVEILQQSLAAEKGYIIPVVFIGNQITNREIDVLLLLPDAIFLLDFKDWSGERFEVEGLNGKIRCLRDGAWSEKDNPLCNYEYAAREIASQLKRERSWLPKYPPIASIMVFTNIDHTTKPPVSLIGQDPQKPEPQGGIGVCRIEQLPQLIAAFRAARARQNQTPVQLSSESLKLVGNLLLQEVKPPKKPRRQRIDGYLILAEHHTDEFLNCQIYLGEGETLKEPVWIKKYEPVFSSPKHRSEREILVLRHADILNRFPQHKNIVDYRIGKSTTSHLYIILSRKPGAFLSELLTKKPLGPTTQADLQRIPFDLNVRLHILGDLLQALEFLTKQPGFEHTAYRDLRPDNIFIQHTNATPIAQLFNFDCTKLPGAATRRGLLKAGSERVPTWYDYASPELLEYVESEPTTTEGPVSFTGDIKSDLFSWAVIAWEILTGELPFATTQDKLSGKCRSWPAQLNLPMPTTKKTRTPEATQVIKALMRACLELIPANRPDLATLRKYFP